MKLNTKFFNLSLLVVFFILMILMYFIIKSDSQCTQNPFTYGAKEISQEDNLEVMCYCNFNDPSYATFSFDKKEIYINSER